MAAAAAAGEVLVIVEVEVEEDVVVEGVAVAVLGSVVVVAAEHPPSRVNELHSRHPRLFDTTNFSHPLSFVTREGERKIEGSGGRGFVGNCGATRGRKRTRWTHEILFRVFSLSYFGSVVIVDWVSFFIVVGLFWGCWPL